MANLPGDPSCRNESCLGISLPIRAEQSTVTESRHKRLHCASGNSTAMAFRFGSTSRMADPAYNWATVTCSLRPSSRGRGRRMRSRWKRRPLSAALFANIRGWPGSPLYGSNDWYYAYGKNSADQTLRDAALIAELSQDNQVRPFTVIDMGWKDGSATFPDMAGLARQIKEHRVRPGLWIRPLEAPRSTLASLLLPAARFGKLSERARESAFDPTNPEALFLITEKVKAPAAWGYELIKHDFSTYDLLGKWGNEMGPEPTSAGWNLHDRTHTNAEVILALYRALRQAAGDKVLLTGCNTVGHLGAGIFESQRTGDDTSGRDWERTRRMGVNTVAYRLPQNNTFFAMDPDCVGITSAIPWELNHQWMQLIATSGAALFISPEPSATGAPQRDAIKEAFRLAASGSIRAIPENWFRDSTPESWIVLENRSPGTPSHYRWSGDAGCSPFAV